jgi:hypothetical protein
MRRNLAARALARVLFVPVLFALLGLAGAASAQDAVKVNAFATWTLDGTVVMSAPEQATLVGSLQGPVFIDSGQGPTYAGQIVCPGTVNISLADGSQQGEGVCAFRAKDGAEAYGKWRCAGYHMVGCKGDFAFTGGSARLAGVAGGSKLLIRGELLELAKAPGPAAAESAIGIIIWQDLEATVPAN